jgi:hypothetical protein
MIGEYTCTFLLYSGEVCGRTCMKPERCCLHKNAITRIPCFDCGRPNHSMSGKCPDHTRSYYVSRHYQKHKKNRTKKLT